jgi:hypothetical protein
MGGSGDGGGLVLSWSVVAAIAGIAAVVATIVYGEIQRRMAGKQLRLAQEEAQLRPKLSVSLRPVMYQPRPPDTEWPHDKVALVFAVTNDGKSAAHNVRNEIDLDERHFAPDEMNQLPKRDLEVQRLGPRDTVPHQVNVDVLSYGPTEAHYVCKCDEVGESEGTIEFEVTERESLE